MPNRRPWLLAAFSLSALSLTACHQKPKADPKAATLATFTNGMVTYLKARGDLCLSKEFPIDVSEREFQVGSRNAIQMPALEHVGLVTSTDTMGEVKTEDGTLAVKVRRYHLTEAGMHYYLNRPVPGAIGSNGQPATHSDLCPVKLSLGKVVRFELSPPTELTSAEVTYTYQVAPAPWLSNPEIQQVFPAVAHVIQGAGTAELKEGFTLTPRGWVANELLPPSAESVANR